MQCFGCSRQGETLSESPSVIFRLPWDFVVISVGDLGESVPVGLLIRIHGAGKKKQWAGLDTKYMLYCLDQFFPD